MFSVERCVVRIPDANANEWVLCVSMNVLRIEVGISVQTRVFVAV